MDFLPDNKENQPFFVVLKIGVPRRADPSSRGTLSGVCHWVRSGAI